MKNGNKIKTSFHEGRGNHPFLWQIFVSSCIGLITVPMQGGPVGDLGEVEPLVVLWLVEADPLEGS
jgi:hypothetical protein